MSIRLSVTAAAIVAAFLVPVAQQPSRAVPQTPRKESPCASPEYHQFDFWVGDWDALDVGKPAVVARNHVDRILAGCVVREDYQDATGMEGQSFSIYDASRKLWHQTWVTNRGRLLVIEGVWNHGEMLLSGSDRTLAGEQRFIRGVWKPVQGGVRETAVISMDSGKTWKPWFDIVFRPHQP